MKILIFDRTRGFGRFINQNFHKDYEIFICNKESEIINIDLELYQIVLFIVSEEKDFLIFFMLRDKAKNLIVGTGNREFELVFNSLKNLHVLDLHLPKLYLKKQILDYLNLVHMNYNYEL